MAKLTPEQLKKIYRPAKTAEELREADREREKLFERRMPRYASLKIAVIATVLFVIVIVFFSNVRDMWFFGQLMGVSFSFVIVMLLLYFYWAFYGYVDTVLYLRGRSMKMAVIMYLGILGVLIGVGGGVAILMNLEWSPGFIACLAGAHLILTVVLARVITSGHPPQNLL